MFTRRSTPEAVPAWGIAPGHRPGRPQLLSPAPARPAAAEVSAVEPATPANRSTGHLVSGAAAADADSSRFLAHPRAVASASAVIGSSAGSERDLIATPTFTDQGAATPLWLEPPAWSEFTDRSRSGRGNLWRERRRSLAPAAALADVSATVGRSIGAYEQVPVAEATGVAVRFAADYLSWDEDEPERREAALRQYVADPRSAVLGWSGVGRQRVELVVPGRTVDFRGAIVVEINARVALYERVGPPPSRLRDRLGASNDPDWPPPGESTPPHATFPASSPPPSAPGWASGAGWWVPLAPPVRRHHDGRLVVDLGLDLSAPS